MKCLEHEKRTTDLHILHSRTLLLSLQTNTLTWPASPVILKREMGEHNKRATPSGGRKSMTLATTPPAVASMTTAAGHSTGASEGGPTRPANVQPSSQQMAAATSSGSAAQASSSVTSSMARDKRELHEIRQLLWGSNGRLDVFRRWSQGKLILHHLEPLLPFFLE